MAFSVSRSEGILRRRKPTVLPLKRRQATEVGSGDESSPGGISSPDTPTGQFPGSTESVQNTLPSPISPTSSANPPAAATSAVTTASSLLSLKPQPSLTSESSNLPQPSATSQLPLSPTSTFSSVISGRPISQPTRIVSFPVFTGSSITISSASTSLAVVTSKRQVTGSSTLTTTKPTSVFPVPQEIENTERPAAERTRAHTSLSHGATIALEVLGIITGILILLGVVFFFYKRLERKRRRRMNEPSSLPPQSPVDTTFISSNQPAMSFTGRINQIRAYLSSNSSPPPDIPSSPDSVVGRAQRLDLVKTELLSEKSKNGTFMKGHQRSVTQDLNQNVAQPLPNLYWTPPSSTDPDPQEPRKAFLKRNTLGRMVLGSKPGATADDEEKLIEKGAIEEDARTFVHSMNGGVPLIKAADGRTKPLTGWRAKLFWPSPQKKHSNGRAGTTTPDMQRGDPTLMSGGLRVSKTVADEVESGTLGKLTH